MSKQVLVTGATGIVGSEVVARLSRRSDVAVTAVSARGDARRGVLAWRLGVESPPPGTAGPWDAIVHAAASTRWSMTSEEAVAANLRSVEALAGLVRDDTRFVHLSTAHSIGHLGDVASDRLDDYRNSYEWSKAASERFVHDELADAVIVRFPIVIGRRADGAITRFTGFYRLLKGFSSGLVPALVALPEAYLDMVPVDDVASQVEKLAVGGRCAETSLVAIGGGRDALRVAEVLELSLSTLNKWRGDQGIRAIGVPPLLTPEQWNRFFLPFAREHLSTVQQRVVDLFKDFQPYLCLTTPFNVTDQIGDLEPALEKAVHYWIQRNPRAATAIPLPWK
ncbi:SDR family oxidoreductase [Nonomuraea sp. NPDC046802]|uniref:SDR family oxidoreductase n=1 Tax=Nonomuraea sp. NPDC046802 TaxID=3154919 RepID=UPI0034086719